MQTIELYFVAISMIWIWSDVARENLFQYKDNLGRVFYRKEWIKKIDRKPINCGTCLSFWIGILLTICTGSIFFLTLPIGYKLIHKQL